MPYSQAFIDGVYAVRWQGFAAEDMAEIVADLERHCLARGSRLPALISIVPENSALPKEDFRKAASTSTKAALQFCHCAILVIEGNGLKGATLRAIASTVASIAQATAKTYVDPTIEAAIQRISTQLTDPPELVIAHLKQHHIAL